MSYCKNCGKRNNAFEKDLKEVVDVVYDVTEFCSSSMKLVNQFFPNPVCSIGGATTSVVGKAMKMSSDAAFDCDCDKGNLNMISKQFGLISLTCDTVGFFSPNPNFTKIGAIAKLGGVTTGTFLPTILNDDKKSNYSREKKAFRNASANAAVCSALLGMANSFDPSPELKVGNAMFGTIGVCSKIVANRFMD